MDATFKMAMDDVENPPSVQIWTTFANPIVIVIDQNVSEFYCWWLHRSQKSRLDEARNYETMPSQGGQWLNV